MSSTSDPRPNTDPPGPDQPDGYTFSIASRRGSFSDGARLRITICGPRGQIAFAGTGVVTTGYADFIGGRIERRTFRPARQQSGSGHQPADNRLRATSAVEGEPDGPADGDDSPGPTAGLPEAGVHPGEPDGQPVPIWIDYEADDDHAHPRPFIHIHAHFHPDGPVNPFGLTLYSRGNHAHEHSDHDHHAP